MTKSPPVYEVIKAISKTVVPYMFSEMLLEIITKDTIIYIAN